jgi:1-acyl-sn-glycerol-3-phosphate acyltransferase
MLALDELWGNSRILDGLFRTFGVIALPREGRRPIAAVRAALRELEAGNTVGVFPEGRRVERWGDVELKRGAAWLSVRSGALLVPMAVWGTQHAMSLDSMRLRRARVEIVVCEALNPADFAHESDPVGALTEALRVSIDREITRMCEPP